MNIPTNFPVLAFIGGGNMASAILGGLLRQGLSQERLIVVESHAPQREKLHTELGISAWPEASEGLANVGLVVWAVKPQSFMEAAAPVAAHTTGALHLSVMAGITTDTMLRMLNTARVVRAMPNTPALIGKGVAGLFARAGVSAQDRELASAVLAHTGECLWVAQESQLDAVTALSGSGPAYVFFFIEVMMRAGEKMGLSAEQARQLAQSTFAGAAALAQQSHESPEVLRERVTSKGGTTHAAISLMLERQIDTHFEAALLAAYARAQQLGKEWG